MTAYTFTPTEVARASAIYGFIIIGLVAIAAIWEPLFVLVSVFLASFMAKMVDNAQDILVRKPHILLLHGVANLHIKRFHIPLPQRLRAYIARELLWEYHLCLPRWVLVTVVIIGMFALSIITIVTVVVPVAIKGLELIRNFPFLAQTYGPEVQKFLANAQEQLNSYNLFDKHINVAFNGILELLTKTFNEGGGMLKGVTHIIAAPLLAIGKGAIVLVLTSFLLGYWHSCVAATKAFLDTTLPGTSKWVALCGPEIQQTALDVVKGYLLVVGLLAPFVFVFFATMAYIFPTYGHLTLANILVLSLFFGLISALPGLGAKAGLFIIVLAGMALFQFKWEIIILTAIFGLIVTTLESKILTPKLIGHALGLNAAITLLTALTSVIMLGISGVLAVIFMILPTLVGIYKALKGLQPTTA